MDKIASELLIERLIDWDVDTIFGLPGDGINGIMEGIRRHKDEIRFFLVHHEEAAAFMATGYAKTTGRLGVCLATSGPGGIHLMNGLYDAKLDHVPVLAITGVQSTTQLGTEYQQEVHLDRTFMDLCVYNQMVVVPVSIPALVDMAVKASLTHRGVSHLTLPVDLQEAPADLNPYPGGLGTARVPKMKPIFRLPRVVPSDEDMHGAADILNAGKRVTMLVGVGARGARNEILEAADLLAAPVIKTLLGKDVLPDNHPLVMGGLGLLGTRPAEEAMDRCDTVFMVGTNFPFTRFLPTDREAVQIDLSGARVGNRMPVDTPLVGDATLTLRALIPLLRRQSDRGHLEKAQRERQKWNDEMSSLAAADREPIQPQYLMSVIDRLADDDAILSSDSGTIATWAARHFEIRGDRRFHLSGNLATMAPGLPYTIAAQIAYPGRQCIAFVGDGGFAMLMAELHSAVWHDLPIKVFICNNGSLGQILWEQMALGFPEHGVRFGTPMRFAEFAAANGAKGIHVEKPAELEGAVKEALEHPGPALVDVTVNPDEPPMPAKITYEEAKNFLAAFLKGQPRRAAITATLFEDKIDQLKGRR